LPLGKSQSTAYPFVELEALLVNPLESLAERVIGLMDVVDKVFP
jgi:hypothetical protein